MRRQSARAGRVRSKRNEQDGAGSSRLLPGTGFGQYSSSRGGADSRGAPGGPGPREVVAADRSECVQDLPAEEKPRMEAALQRARIDLVERDASAGHLRAPVAFVPSPVERMPGERLD